MKLINFLILKHGNDSENKLPYSHIDIAGSSGNKNYRK